MNHVAGALPLETTHRRIQFDVPQLVQPKGIHHLSDGQEGRLEVLGDAADRTTREPTIRQSVKSPERNRESG